MTTLLKLSFGRRLPPVILVALVDLVGVDLFQYMPKCRPVGKISVVRHKLYAAHMGVMVELVDAVRIKKAGSAYDAVNLVSLLQQETDEIGTVLSGYAGDECPFCAMSR